MISPNLTVSAIKEKPSFSTGALAETFLQEGLLYAGTDKDAFWVSNNDGLSWGENDSGPGNNMPGAAIADPEIHESTMDLIAATHGSGIYNIYLRPVHSLVNNIFSIDKDYLFDITESQSYTLSSKAGLVSINNLYLE